MKSKVDFIQEAILNYIIDYISLHGYAPSYREIAEGINGKSLSVIQYHINRLYDLGLLETDAENRTARAIRVPGYKFVKAE